MNRANLSNLAVVWREVGKVTVKSVPVPEPAPHEVSLRCGRRVFVEPICTSLLLWSDAPEHVNCSSPNEVKPGETTQLKSGLSPSHRNPEWCV